MDRGSRSGKGLRLVGVYEGALRLTGGPSASEHDVTYPPEA